MRKQYGPEKAEKVFYASKNKGKISGVYEHMDSYKKIGLLIAEALGLRVDEVAPLVPLAALAGRAAAGAAVSKAVSAAGKKPKSSQEEAMERRRKQSERWQSRRDRWEGHSKSLPPQPEPPQK